MPGNKLYFKNLDTIRFIAALMVYLAHGIYSSFGYLPVKNTIWEKVLFTICDGKTGVSIFFVLSGFLITYILLNEKESQLKISLKNFYLRRVLRIWPLYFLVLAFSFLFYPLFKSIIGMNNPLDSNVLYYLTFLSNFNVINMHARGEVNDALSQSITWSVSIEEQFYLFWPLLFVFLPKRFWLYSILLSIAGSVFFRVIHYQNETVLYFHTFSVLLDLAIGGLFAYLVKEVIKFRSFFEKSSTLTHLVLFAFSFVMVFWGSGIFSFKYGNAIERAFISISFGLIITAQALTMSESKMNLKNITFANNWGKYTYGIYLIHPVALTLIDVLVRVFHIPKNSFVSSFSIGVTGFAVTLLLSKICYKYYESRFLLMKDKFAGVKTYE